MKKTKIIMGMPVTIEVIELKRKSDLEDIFRYFQQVDSKYSTYKENSEITRINHGLPKDQWSKEMKDVLKLCDETSKLTNGYFNIKFKDNMDPSGLVKGWAINNAAKILREKGFKNFYIEAGGDIQVAGHNENRSNWLVGIRNPFNIKEIIKVVSLSKQGIATSGTYIRGNHIYNPLKSDTIINSIKSLSVIGPNIFEADRMATAAFAMGTLGISFLEKLKGFEAYMVDDKKIATFTSGFNNFVVNNV